MNDMTIVKTTVNVSLTDALKELAKRQAEEKHFSTMSEYITHLIQDDIDKSSVNQLNENPGSSLNGSTQANNKSGPSNVSGSEVHAQSRKEIIQVITEQFKK